MKKFYKPARMAIIFIIMAAMLTVYVASLYKLQIYDVRPLAEDAYPEKQITNVETIPAVRGDIYDCNGVLLVSSRPAYNLTLSRSSLNAADDTNGIILDFLHTAIEHGIKYTDTFPMTIGAPFDFLSGMDRQQRTILDKYLERLELDPDITATELFNWMKDHYKLDYKTGISDARLIIGVRYELETRVFGMNTSQYVFAEDVGEDFVALIKEKRYPGIIIETSSLREYHTENAAHLLGNIGKLDENDYEKFKDLDYPLDALVGKSGVELAFEEYLHGTAGRRTVVTSSDGSVLGITVTQEPVPGNDVYLTLDIRLQGAVEDALKEYIDEINLTREEDTLVTGGAVVVTDVNTGKLLASASYPTYNPATYKRDYPTLVSDTVYRPLTNRATQGRYSPGSTFKMVTAFAGLRVGTIGRWTEIVDTGRFTKYANTGDGFAPMCWIYSREGHGHGAQNVIQALENSCNVFFYQLGDSLGAMPIVNAAAEFGFGEKTGLHVSENKGLVSSPEYVENVLNIPWVAADHIMSAIGQSHNQFTPVQLANYTATIANNGTLYALSELSKVKSHDSKKLIYEHTPTVMNQFSEEDIGYLKIIQEGMRAAAKTGTANEFASYPVSVAAKTGTVQNDASKVDNGVFVCYAPYSNPEVAISVVIERGTSGKEIMGVARSVLDFYFEGEPSVPVVPDGDLMQ